MKKMNSTDSAMMNNEVKRITLEVPVDIYLDDIIEEFPIADIVRCFRMKNDLTIMNNARDALFDFEMGSPEKAIALLKELADRI